MAISLDRFCVAVVFCAASNSTIYHNSGKKGTTLESGLLPGCDSL